MNNQRNSETAYFRLLGTKHKGAFVHDIQIDYMLGLYHDKMWENSRAINALLTLYGLLGNLHLPTICFNFRTQLLSKYLCCILFDLIRFFKNFPTAYKEKMKELSVLSLICSCFYPETRNKLVCEFEGMKDLKNWFSLQPNKWSLMDVFSSLEEEALINWYVNGFF